MLFKFENFSLSTKVFESRLHFSDEFMRVLRLIPNDSEVKNHLLGMKGSDLKLNQNFIDLSDNKEEVTFIQDRRAQQILQQNKPMWITTSDLPGSKYLSFKKNSEGQFINEKIFEILGFVPQEPVEENHPIPGPGIVGEIVSEAIGPQTGRTYVVFKWNDGNQERLICLNKVALESSDDGIQKVYTTNRNPMRIGRLVNSLMSAANLSVTPQQIEQFTNQWKSAWDTINDAFLKFDVVSGYQIQKWYAEENYESDESTLGGSCMRYDYCEEYFGIYTENSDVVKLVILYSDLDGRIDGNKYTSSKIKGRALLWKTNQGDMFMDRIYTNNDSDVELFKQYAEKQGWWCKKVQNSQSKFTAQRGVQTKKDPVYTVDLNWADHEYYPYVDTLSFLRLNEFDSRDASGVLSNDVDVIGAQFELRDTEGDRDTV